MRRFNSFHPFVNLIYFITVLVFSLVFPHPVTLLTALVMTTAYNIKIGGKQGAKMSLCLLSVIIFSAVINGLTAHYGITVLGTLPDGNRLCLEPIVYGGVSGAVAVCCINILSAMSKNISSDKLFALICKFLPKTAMLCEMVLRFVPLYGRKIKETAVAQKNFKSESSYIKQGTRILSSVMGQALEGAMKSADSMKGRGYGLGKRTYHGKCKFRLADCVLLGVIFLFGIIIIIGALMGNMYVLYNPYFEINELDIFSILIYGIYALMYAIPLVLDLAEDIKWKRS